MSLYLTTNKFMEIYHLLVETAKSWNYNYFVSSVSAKSVDFVLRKVTLH